MGIATGDQKADVERMKKETGIAYPIYLDSGPAAERFGVESSPTCILIGTDGAIRYRGPHPPQDFQ